jgi:hypothetical protein
MNARGKLIVTVVPGAQPTHRRPRSSRGPLGVALVSLTLALAVLAGCGGDDETAFTPVEGTESAYCDTFRAWQVHELEGEGDDQPNPTALEAYWNDYLEFNATMLEQSPPEVRDEWELSERLIRTTVTPVLEKYDFDAERIAREGTPAEKGITEPPPEAQKAQDAIHTYEARVCGVEQPPAADVVFEADDSSEPYCMAAGATQSEFDKIASAKFDPDLLRTFLTSDRLTELLDAQVDAAPDEIAADVEAERRWLTGRWRDVFDEYDYDIRGVWVDGTAEDRAVIHEYHPDVVEHSSRITAYEEQVCAG